MVSLRNGYLFTYNMLQAAGWAVALFQVIDGIQTTGSLAGAYEKAGNTVALFQLISAIEILHAAVGIIGGSPVAALMQWGGRSNVLFAIIRCVPEVQATVAVGATVFVWSLSEVIRYPWYAAGTAGTCPYWLTWLRYTAFIPLYPVGVMGEMAAVYLALPYIGQRKLHYVMMPNKWNMAFDYKLFMMGVMSVYPFLWWQLYSMLLRQRSKKLSSGDKGSAGSATAVKTTKKRK